MVTIYAAERPSRLADSPDAISLFAGLPDRKRCGDRHHRYRYRSEPRFFQEAHPPYFGSVLTATLSPKAVDELSGQPWVRQLRLSH